MYYQTYPFLTLIFAPEEIDLKTMGSPEIWPNILTGLYARGLSFLLTGVDPKNMQNAFPMGQYPRSPISTSSLASGSCSKCTGMVK